MDEDKACLLVCTDKGKNAVTGVMDNCMIPDIGLQWLMRCCGHEMQWTDNQSLAATLQRCDAVTEAVTSTFLALDFTMHGKWDFETCGRGTAHCIQQRFQSSTALLAGVRWH